MALFSSNKKNIDPKKEARMRQIIEELEISSEAFQDESRIRMHHLREHLEDAHHEYNVAKHEIKEDVIRGLKKMNEAASTIAFPDGE